MHADGDESMHRSMATKYDEMLRVLEARASAIESEIKALVAERSDIDVARKAIVRLQSTSPSGDDSRAGYDSGGAGGSPRPAGIPATWEMVEQALRVSGPMTSGELVAYIRDLWWPGLVSKQVLPQIYGMLKGNPHVRIAKVEGKFMLDG